MYVPEDGALFTFGERDSGKLGLSTAQVPNHKVPQQVEGICEKVLQVACGGGHTLALTGITTVVMQRKEKWVTVKKSIFFLEL